METKIERKKDMNMTAEAIEKAFESYEHTIKANTEYMMNELHLHCRRMIYDNYIKSVLGLKNDNVVDVIKLNRIARHIIRECSKNGKEIPQYVWVYTLHRIRENDGYKQERLDYEIDKYNNSHTLVEILYKEINNCVSACDSENSEDLWKSVNAMKDIIESRRKAENTLNGIGNNVNGIGG